MCLGRQCVCLFAEINWEAWVFLEMEDFLMTFAVVVL